MAFGEPRVSYKLEKVSDCASTGNAISWLSHKLSGDVDHASTREDHSYCRKMSEVSHEESDHCSEACGIAGSDDFISAGHSPSTAALSTSSDDANSRFVAEPVISGESDVNTGLLARVEVVDLSNEELERQSHSQFWSGFNNKFGRIQERLGCSSRFAENTGSVDGGGEGPPHKCPRTERRALCIENLSPGSAESSCSFKDGQQDSSIIYTENGRDKKCSDAANHSGDLAVLPGQGNIPFSRVPAWQSELRGRLAKPEFSRQQRLASESLGIQKSESDVRPLFSRPLCESTQCSTPKVRELASGPLFGGSGCLPANLERGGPLYVPSICHDPKMPIEDSAREGNSNINCPPMAIPAMVSNAVISSGPETHSTPTIQGSVDLTEPGKPPPVGTEKVSASGMETLRRHDIDQGVSEDAAKLLSEFSWRRGTTNAYNSSWRQWSSWCSGKQINPFHAPVVEVVNYLTEQFHRGDSYRTLNSRRSAISAFHVPVDGVKVGQHTLVKRLLNALFNARPPQPRYVLQWDVDQVLQYIKSLGSNEFLSDKDLTFKLAMLLALASASRSSDCML